MSLEVLTEFLGGVFQGYDRLFHSRVPGFYVYHCFAHVVVEPLFFVSYVSKQNNTDRTVRYDQIHVKLFAILGAAQNGWLSEIAPDFLKRLLAFICPTKHACLLEREEEMPQLVCETGYKTPQSG